MVTSRLAARLVSDAAEFARLGTEWDALLQRSESSSIFLSWGWLYAWWQCFGESRALRVCEVRDTSGRLVGIGPFCIQRDGRLPRLRLLTFLGTERVSSEYLDIIAEPGLEADVVAAVWGALDADRASWDLARWPDMLDQSVVLRHVERWGTHSTVLRDVRPSQICPFLALAPAFEEQMNAFGSNLRMNVRRKMRAIERAGVEIATIDTVGELPPALEALYTLHEKRWMREDHGGNFRDARVRAFHARLVEHLGPLGRMRLYTLRREGRTLAVVYTLQHKGILSYYQSGYEPDVGFLGLAANEYSPGFTLLAHAILDGARLGLLEFDFLRGPEAYKNRWTRTHRVTRCLSLVPRRNWRAIGRHRVDRGIAISRRIVSRLLRRGPTVWGTEA